MTSGNISTSAPSSPLGSIDPGGAEILDWSGQGRFGAATGGDDEPLRIFAYNKKFTAEEGDQLDRIAAAAGTYDDGRSDDKGVGPEHVEIATL